MHHYQTPHSFLDLLPEAPNDPQVWFSAPLFQFQ